MKRIITFPATLFAGNLAVRGLLGALAVLYPAVSHAQGATEAWVQRYNGPGNGDDVTWALAVDASNKVIVTGYSTGSGTDWDYLTIKYSSAGVPLWTNRYNGPGNSLDQAHALAVDLSGNVYVTGESFGSGSSSDWATIKYSSAGVPIWTNRYNGPANSVDDATALALDTSGNVIVTGDSYNGADYDFLTIKYSGDGVPLWTNRYNGPANGHDYPQAVAVDANGGVVVAGQARDAAGSRFATIKYSGAGVPLWTNLYGGSNDLLLAMTLDNSGNVVVTGRSQVDTNTYNDFLTIKYSSAGVPLWTNRYTGRLTNGSDIPYAVAVDASGNVVVTGTSEGSGGSMDYGTIKYSSAGELLWTNFYNGSGNADEARAATVDANGNVYVTGVSGLGTERDIATVAYSSSGLPLWTNRYNGPSNSFDFVWYRAIAVDASGSVYVTGSSANNLSFPYDYDFTTIKYVVPAVIITRQPSSCTNAVGTTASFTVEAWGNGPLSYQWRCQGTNLMNGGNISGVTTTNLLIANVQLADAAGYSVVVTNAYGSVTSSVAQLTVTIPPKPGRFSNLSYSPETGFSFIFRDGTLGRQYRIQTSSSLAEGSWVDWRNFTYDGPAGFIDGGATGSERRFYRAISP